jgi:DNA-binding beta-propeller fold protein YncE
MKRILFSLLALGACREQIVYESGDPWLDRTAVPPLGAGKIVVTNNGEDSITWIDLESLEVVATTPVGLFPAEREGPHHGTASPDGSTIYVGLSNSVPMGGGGPHGSHGTGTSDGYVLAVDPATGSVTAATLVDRNPGDIRITPDGRWLLVSHFDLLRIQEVMERGGTLEEMSSRLAIVDARTMERRQLVPICPAAHGIAPAADGSRVWVTCYATDELAEISLAPPYEVVRHKIGGAPVTPLAPAEGPYAVSLHPTDGSVWLSCQTTGTIRIFSGGVMGPPIPVGGVPYFGTFTSDGGTFLVPSQGSETLSFLDGATGAVERTMALPAVACRRPHAVLVLPGDQRALVVCEGDHVGKGTVAVVNIAIPTPAVEKFVRVGVFPDDLVLVRP